MGVNSPRQKKQSAAAIPFIINVKNKKRNPQTFLPHNSSSSSLVENHLPQGTVNKRNQLTQQQHRVRTASSSSKVATKRNAKIDNDNHQIPQSNNTAEAGMISKSNWNGSWRANLRKRVKKRKELMTTAAEEDEEGKTATDGSPVVDQHQQTSIPNPNNKTEIVACKQQLHQSRCWDDSGEKENVIQTRKEVVDFYDEFIGIGSVTKEKNGNKTIESKRKDHLILEDDMNTCVHLCLNQIHAGCNDFWYFASLPFEYLGLHQHQPHQDAATPIKNMMKRTSDEYKKSPQMVMYEQSKKEHEARLAKSYEENGSKENEMHNGTQPAGRQQTMMMMTTATTTTEQLKSKMIMNLSKKNNRKYELNNSNDCSKLSKKVKRHRLTSLRKLLK